MAQLTGDRQLISQSVIGNFSGSNVYLRMYAWETDLNSSNSTGVLNLHLCIYLDAPSAYSIQTYDGISSSVSGLASMSENLAGYQSVVGGEEKLILAKTATLQHDNSGNLSGTLTGNANITNWYSGSTSVSVTARPIPRQASITSFSANGLNENAIRVSWSANASIDAIQYSLNGQNWVATSGIVFDIGSLVAGTQYSIKIRVKRADNQIWTESGTIYATTYAYPYVTGVTYPNLIIGNQQVLNLYNPLSRNVTIKMYQNTTSGTELYSGTTNGQSITFTPNATTLYNSIPSATNSACVYSVIYGSSVATTSQQTYLINANECKPIFEDFNYSTNLRELTGNNDTIINGRTTTTFTIPSNKKAVGKNGASISRYVFVCGSSNPIMANYSNDDVTAQITNCDSDIIKVTAIDSRNLETTVTKTITNFKNYFNPTFLSMSAEREDGVEEDVFLDMKMQFWNYNFGYRRNSILYLKYRVKESSSSTYSNWFEINTSLLNIDNEEATLTNARIYKDGISQGFTIGTQYDLQLQVIDGNGQIELNEVVSDTFTLIDGKVAFSILKDSNGEYHIGINGMPDLNNTMKVYGTIVDDNS